MLNFDDKFMVAFVRMYRRLYGGTIRQALEILCFPLNDLEKLEIKYKVVSKILESQ